jgi:putative lipoprotein
LRGTALALIFALSAHAAEPDSWFGNDKALHFGFSGALAIGGYGAATAFSESSSVRLGYGASVALLAGVGKELWDASGHGTPSLRDFTWDLVGIAVGLAICWALDEWLFGVKRIAGAGESPARTPG